jgi:hypothetical protein
VSGCDESPGDSSLELSPVTSGDLIPPREPEPIDINRYVIPSGASADIPTFTGFPDTMNSDELRGDGVDVAVARTRPPT